MLIERVTPVAMGFDASRKVSVVRRRVRPAEWVDSRISILELYDRKA
jgi:hypothetical protein